MANQQSDDEKKGHAAELQALSIWENEKKVDARLREVLGNESLASFSRRCGISEGGLRKYLEGASPSTTNLIAMADTANVNIEWLAAGRGPKMRGSAPEFVKNTVSSTRYPTRADHKAGNSTPDRRSNSPPPTRMLEGIYADNVPSQEHRDPSPLASESFDDLARLQMAIETVQEALTAANKQLPPDKLAQVIAISYKLLENMDQRESVANLIKMAA